MNEDISEDRSTIRLSSSSEQFSDEELKLQELASEELDSELDSIDFSELDKILLSSKIAIRNAESSELETINMRCVIAETETEKYFDEATNLRRELKELRIEKDWLEDENISLHEHIEGLNQQQPLFSQSESSYQELKEELIKSKMEYAQLSGDIDMERHNHTQTLNKRNNEIKMLKERNAELEKQNGLYQDQMQAMMTRLSELDPKLLVKLRVTTPPSTSLTSSPSSSSSPKTTSTKKSHNSSPFSNKYSPITLRGPMSSPADVRSPSRMRNIRNWFSKPKKQTNPSQSHMPLRQSPLKTSSTFRSQESAESIGFN